MNTLLVIYLIAISTEAMTGALAAGKRNMDLFGVSLIAFVTALGGGTARDILLGNFPVTWTQHPEHVHLVLFFGLLTVVVQRLIKRFHEIFNIIDAFGLVAFSIIGANVATELNYNDTIVVISAITTGIFGGILRDILCNRTPLVLKKELYASIAFLVGLLYVCDVDIMLVFFIGLFVRFIAMRYNLGLMCFKCQ